MKTVTFFSYKGGTGRSLAVANASRYLARLGFKVAAMDFDLEAPGLHYKFQSSTGKSLEVQEGVLDYLHEMLHGSSTNPPDLARFFFSVPVEEGVAGSITLIPAGRVPSPEYWPKLAAINWHQLLYAESGVGVKLFLELKERIADELQPDFLLIDSRTGVTEMAGVATSILADAVIALVLRTLENLEGSRAVLRSLLKTRRIFQLPPLVLTVALSRFPKAKDDESEPQVVEEVRQFLNEPASELEETLAIDQVEVLHIEEALHQKETLRVGGDVSPDESILYRDYLRLFRCLVSKDEMVPRLGGILSTIHGKLLENPEACERDLEELAHSYGHPTGYLELLRFYRLRKDHGAKALRTAQTFWEITGRDGREPLLWYFVNGLFFRRNYWERDQDKWKPDLEFFESTWRNAGNRDAKFAQLLAGEFERLKRINDAVRILCEATEDDNAPVELVAQALSVCTRSGARDCAFTLIQRFKDRWGNENVFLTAWAEAALAQKLPAEITALVEPTILERLKKPKPALVASVLRAAGRAEEAKEFVTSVLQGLQEPDDFMRYAEFFKEAGEMDRFRARGKERLSEQVWREISERIDRRW